MARKKAKQLEDGTLEIGTMVQRLAVKMDEKAIALAGVRLASVLQKHGEFEVQSKGVRDGLKQQEAAIQQDIDSIAAAIRAGVELQDVEVSVRADFTKGVAEFVRTDTGETLTKRTLTDDERQKKMVFDIEEADSLADAAAAAGDLPKVDISGLSEEEPSQLKRDFDAAGGNGEVPPAA